jgi:hypothetical protein
MATPPKELLGPGVFHNYALTPLMPFPGGTVEVLSGLVAVQGASGWKTAVKVLEKFSGLVASPLGQTLTLAREVTGAISDFMQQSNGQVHLGLHQAFSAVGGGGANAFKAGYLAVIGAPKNQFKSANLVVDGDQLYHVAKAGAAPVAMQGVDYMLFRIEAREERDDWQLPNINEPWEKARAAYATSRANEGKEHKATAIAAAFLSSDLTKPDQLRVAKAIKADIEEVEKLGQGAIGEAAPDLKTCVEAQGLTMAAARSTPRPSLDELLS